MNATPLTRPQSITYTATCLVRLVYGEGPAHLSQHRREGWTQTCCAACGKFVWCKEADGSYLCAEDLPAEVTR